MDPSLPKGCRTSGEGEDLVKPLPPPVSFTSKGKVDPSLPKGCRTSGAAAAAGAGEEKVKPPPPPPTEERIIEGEGKRMDPSLPKGCRTSGAGEEIAVNWALSAVAEIISVGCMKTAMALACIYFAFISYVALNYTPSWAEKLRLSPLFLFAIIVLLLGAVMIREQRKGCV